MAPARARVSEKVHHLITGGSEDGAWRTDQCTAETPSEGARLRGVQILKETQQKRRLGVGRHLLDWGIVDACHINGDLEVATSGFGRFLYGRGPKCQTRIGFPIFNSDDFGPGPLKCFYCFSILEGHPVQVVFNIVFGSCYGVPLSSMRSLLTYFNVKFPPELGYGVRY